MQKGISGFMFTSAWISIENRINLFTDIDSEEEKKERLILPIEKVVKREKHEMENKRLVGAKET